MVKFDTGQIQNWSNLTTGQIQNWSNLTSGQTPKWSNPLTHRRVSRGLSQSSPGRGGYVPYYIQHFLSFGCMILKISFLYRSFWFVYKKTFSDFFPAKKLKKTQKKSKRQIQMNSNPSNEIKFQKIAYIKRCFSGSVRRGDSNGHSVKKSILKLSKIQARSKKFDWFWHFCCLEPLFSEFWIKSLL